MFKTKKSRIPAVYRILLVAIAVMAIGGIAVNGAIGNHDAGFLRRIGRPSVSYTHLRAHETGRNLVCRLLLEKKKP